MAGLRATSPNAWRALLNAATEEWRSTPFYRNSLNGSDPQRVLQWGRDPRFGDPERGREILRGQWRIATEKLHPTHPIPWAVTHPSPHFTARLHSFSWLIDLASIGADSYPLAAKLIETWAQAYGDWHDAAWAPELVSERLYAWMCHGQPALARADPAMQPALLRSIGRQARHLLQAAKDIHNPIARIKAGAALVVTGCAIADGEAMVDLGKEILVEACASQFHPDGGHLSRSPEACLMAVCDLMTADDALARKGVECPRLMHDTQTRTATLLRLLRYPDGALANFHGGSESDPRAIARILTDLHVAEPAFQFATQSGYQRIVAGETTFLMDVGPAPPRGFGERAHASALAFELCSGGDRLIVNVGAARELAPEWRAAARATNGHSTLGVDDALSAPFRRRGLRGAAEPSGPDVRSKRTEGQEWISVEAEHEGYRASYGFIHRRTISLDASGRRVAGLDQLSRPFVDGKASSQRAIPYAIRFHLHPGVRAGWHAPREPKLETPGGRVWRMKTDAVQVRIEDSVYLSAANTPQRSTQVVMFGEADPNGAGTEPSNQVFWQLIRID
ncbi:MAG: hypothetical protein GC189_07425 [Alphaproteobacteria bacterium]|nr:hypothetical protein [Alphaproteobacteria bacterium]